MTKIFSGDYSRDMWRSINRIQYKDVQEALYMLGCRLQEFEHKLASGVDCCPQHEKPLARFIEKRNGYLDTKTGLEWDMNSYGRMPWYEAMNFFHPPWRLPTIKELLTLVDYTKYGPATKLPDMKSSFYWSSTTTAITANCAWSVHFSSGNDYRHGKSNYHYIRAVRGGQEGRE